MTNKRLMRKCFFISLLLQLTWLGLIAPVVQADTKPVLELSMQSTQSIEVGDRMEVIVSGKSLKDVYAYELNFTYDPLRLRLAETTSKIKGFTLSPVVSGNRIKLAHTKVSNVQGESGDLAVAVLTFEAMAGGRAAVQLHKAELVDSKLKTETYHPASSVTVSIDGAQPSSYTDIARHWAESSIIRAAELGIVTGYSNGTFRPNENVSRAEFATMLSRTMDFPVHSGEKLPFADSTAIPQWARANVGAASNSGLIKGYENGTFGPERYLIRSEMAAIVVRAAAVAVTNGAHTTFADDQRIPGWAKPYVAAGASVKLLAGQGNNRFAPMSHMTRAEAVAVLLGLQDHLNKKSQ